MNNTQSFQEILKGLNTAQLDAVNQTEGPVLVVAGPGTGKTQILAARIGNILNQTDAAPHNILCLTYTDAGTIAMRQRLVQFIGPEAYNVNIYTFHGFCNMVIQENLDKFGIRSLQPATDLEIVEVIQSVIDGFGPDHPLKRYTGDIYYEVRRLKNVFDLMKRENWSFELIENAVKKYIEDLPNREDYQYKGKYKEFKKGDPKQAAIDAEADKVNKLVAGAGEFANYEKVMRKRARYDYQDMILWVLNAFENDPDLLLTYQEQYHYFLVDEYQDTNGAQNTILNQLSKYWEVPNVFVVGDDDQSIYRFQGANITNIYAFDQAHKSNIKRVVLTENYRSSQAILDASRFLIDNNNDRLVSLIDGLTKELSAAGENSEIRELPEVMNFQTQIQEEATIIQELEKLIDQVQDLNEVAVIYRSHRQVENIVRYCEINKIPINLKQRVNILELPLINNINVLLQYIEDQHKLPGSSEERYFHLMHFPWFGIDPLDAARISRAIRYKNKEQKITWLEFTSNDKLLFEAGVKDPKPVLKLAKNIASWISSLSGSTLQGLFEKILTYGRLLEWIMKQSDKAWQLQVVTTYFNFIKEESVRNPKLEITGFMDVIERMQKNNIRLGVSKMLQSVDGINFVTAHSSKGLEFEHVFMLGCNSDIWESKRNQSNEYKLPDTLVPSLSENKVEEERRLFYVAMTRARKRLWMSFYNEDYNGKPKERSRYLVDLLEKQPELEKAGDVDEEKVMHYAATVLQSVDNPVIKLIDKDLIEETLKDFRLSATSLNKYLDCPLSFYFENILKVPSSRNQHAGLGSAVHYALEVFFREMKESESKEFDKVTRLIELFEFGMNIYRSHFTVDQYERWMEYGSKSLTEYANHYLKDWNKSVVLEYNIFNAQLNGVPLSGKLDKLEFEKNEVNVVDYKTGSVKRGKPKLVPPNEKNPQGTDYWRQLVFYKILMDADSSKPWNMISGEMDFIQTDDKDNFFKKQFYVSPEDISVVTNQIEESYSRIQKHEFENGCGKDDCQWCNFVKYNFDSENLKLEEIGFDD